MNYLKKINFTQFVFLILASNCATSTTMLLKQHENTVELKVAPNRVLLECELQPAHDIEGAHGFLMYILDDHKTVITAAQANVLDKNECFEGLQYITKILKTGKVIYIGGMGDLTKSKAGNHRTHNFPNLGTFPSSGKSMKFMIITNEHGLCFDAHNGANSPCPSEPFSFKNL